MVIKRLAAVVLAVALVVGAVLVRARIDRSPATTSGPTSTTGSGANNPAPTTPSVFTLVCVTEQEATPGPNQQIVVATRAPGHARTSTLAEHVGEPLAGPRDAATPGKRLQRTRVAGAVG